MFAGGVRFYTSVLFLIQHIVGGWKCLSILIVEGAVLRMHSTFQLSLLVVMNPWFWFPPYPFPGSLLCVHQTTGRSRGGMNSLRYIYFEVRTYSYGIGPGTCSNPTSVSHVNVYVEVAWYILPDLSFNLRPRARVTRDGLLDICQLYRVDRFISCLLYTSPSPRD